MSRPVAALVLLMITMFWGLAFVAQKFAMGAIGPLTFTGARYLLGGLVILPLALWEYRRKPAAPGHPRITARQWRFVLLLSAVFFCGSYLQQVGLTVTTVTNGGFLTGLYVLFVPLIAFIAIRQKPHPVIFLGVPLALVGLYFLNGGGLDGFNAGDWLVIASAVFWGGHVLLLGHFARETGLPIFISAVSFLFAGAVAMLLAFAFEVPRLDTMAQVWVPILYSGLISTALAFTLQAIAQQYVPPANAAIVLSAESLFAALGGALVLGERLPPIGYAGAGLMFCAIVLVEALPAWRHARQPPQMEAH